jgi:phosphatidylserine decarboxylase
MGALMNRVLIAQLVILVLCVGAVMELALNFPYPSPLVRPFLPPRERWPTRQIQHWVDMQHYPSSFLEYFSRDPDRIVPPGDNVVAPADGVVEMVLHRNNTSYLVIAMSFWDVHVIRSPVAGIVTALDEQGIRVTRDKMSEPEKVENIYESGKDAPVQKIVSFQTAFGDVRLHIITSYWASRIKVWVRKDEKIAKGERVGRILLGSTTVLEVPGNVSFRVSQGERVWGGESIVYGHNRRR